jgi:signal transduction histidine kinase
MILEALQKDKMDNIEKYATEIYKSAHHSYNLLNNLLDWSRVQRGTMAFEPQEVELKSIVDKTINLLKVNSDSKNIFLESSFDPGLKVYGDRFMLETVMRNLISNAIKYTPKGGKIHLTAKRKKDKTLLSVKDNGLGIKQENLEKLFRIEDSFSTKGTEKEQGTGLGLILCKEFVEKHGGEIWVDSEVNKGTTFYVSIPDRG